MILFSFHRFSLLSTDFVCDVYRKQFVLGDILSKYSREFDISLTVDERDDRKYLPGVTLPV